MKNLVTFIFALFVTVLLAGGFWFMYAHIASGISRAQTAHAQSEALSARDALVRSQQIFLESVSVERDQIASFVASDADVVAVIEIIEDTARQARVSVAISSINTLDGEGWGYHEKVAVNFSASGSFANMTSFMSALETLPTASILESASLEAEAQSRWFGTFTITFVKNR
jgi:hypothetical protein